MPAAIHRQRTPAVGVGLDAAEDGAGRDRAKMQTLRTEAVYLSFSLPKPSASGGTAAMSSRLVHRPCRMWPTMNIAGS